jgi:hypothetical protein
VDPSSAALIEAEVETLNRKVRSAEAKKFHVSGGDALWRDTVNQILGVDSVARKLEPGVVQERQLLARRAALTLLEAIGDPQVFRYYGMLGRGRDVPPQPRFIAEVEGAKSRAVLKTYGFFHDREARALQLYQERGQDGFVRLLNTGTHDGSTWVLLEKIDGPSLNEYWGGHDQPPPHQNAIKETREVATIIREAQQHVPSDPESYPLVGTFVTPNAQMAIGWLEDNGYADYIKPGARQFVESAYDTHKPVLVIGEPCASNVMRKKSGELVLIDPTSMWGPAAFDCAFWAARTAPPTAIGELLQPWLEQQRNLDPHELANCLAAELLRHAGVLEIMKRERGDDWRFKDGRTLGLLAASNALRDSLERDQIHCHDDILSVLGDTPRILPGVVEAGAQCKSTSGLVGATAPAASFAGDLL